MQRPGDAARAIMPQLLAIYADAASRGAPTPSSFQLQESRHLPGSRETIFSAKGMLASAGLIAIEKRGNRERITVTKTGHCTAWTITNQHRPCGEPKEHAHKRDRACILCRKQFSPSHKDNWFCSQCNKVRSEYVMSANGV